MRIGKLDRRIVIEQQVTAKDDWNYDYTTWTTYATVWVLALEERPGASTHSLKAAT